MEVTWKIKSILIQFDFFKYPLPQFEIGICSVLIYRHRKILPILVKDVKFLCLVWGKKPPNDLFFGFVFEYING